MHLGYPPQICMPAYLGVDESIKGCEVSSSLQGSHPAAVCNARMQQCLVKAHPPAACAAFPKPLIGAGTACRMQAFTYHSYACA